MAPLSPLDCDRARDLLSARLDGELDPSDDHTALDAHLETCEACAAWQDEAFALRRVTTLRAARPAEDPAAAAQRVLVRAGVPDPGAGDWVRYALGVVAATILALHLPQLVGLGDAVSHDTRHLGAFGVALGAGLLWSAIRPERSIGLVPLAAALAVAMTVGAAVDLTAGRSTMGSEAVHLLEALGLGLLWYLSGGPRRLAARHLPSLTLRRAPAPNEIGTAPPRWRARLTPSWLLRERRTASDLRRSRSSQAWV